MQKKALSVLLCALLCACLSLPAGGEGLSPGERPVISVNGTDISPERLREELRLELFLGALGCAGYGYGLDITDPLTIEDEADKTVFALEDGIILRMLEKVRGISLGVEDLEAARERAAEEWERYRAIARGGMAFLPAGDHEPSPDPEEDLTRYFASFGLTELVLFERALRDLLDEKLYQDYAAGLEGTKDEKLVACAEWQLSFLDAAEVFEDGEAIALLCRTLWE